VVVYYGPLVNRRVKLSDELNFLYTLANPQGQELMAEVRSVIKELRERLGMVVVLQCLIECQRFYKSARLTERLCEYIRDRRLLSIPVIDGILKKNRNQLPVDSHE
jgi:hypothetical protein